MVLSCCATGCANRKGQKPNIAFYRIPFEAERRQLWITAINRKDWKPSMYSRLCSEHFVQGKKSQDPLSPDYVPSLFAHTKFPEKRKEERNLEEYDQRRTLKKRRRQGLTKQEVARALLNLFVKTEEDEVAATVSDTRAKPTCDAVCQTDLTSDDIESLPFDCQQLRGETFALKDKLSLDLLEQSTFENKDKLNTFTGLANSAVFKAVLDLVKPSLKHTARLTPFQQILVTLMRIRLNLSLAFLSYLFGVHISTISGVFTNVINVLNEVLVPVCVFWPKREDVQKSLPVCFRKSFKHCMAVINCFEIAIEKPASLRARAQTYSQYNAHNTMKYLISISPQGVITFISKGWGGQATDAHITANSGFLDHLLPGDLVLADRGFNIQDQVGLYFAKVETPAFTQGEKQLGAIELEESGKLAAVRIHVDRVIGQVRSKYKMLQGPVPIGLLQHESQYTTLDKIVRVTCALSNLCPSVVPIDQPVNMKDDNDDNMKIHG